MLQEFRYGEKVLPNFINGKRQEPQGEEKMEITNPATGDFLCTMTSSTREEVEEAADAAAEAFRTWSTLPVSQRIERLLLLRQLISQEAENISRLIVMENGKTIDEARGEVRRGIENIDASFAALYFMDGRRTTGIAPGIDEELIREPLGVFAAVTPFNFPMMIPFWFIPYALATGNTFILKPSERTPVTMNYIMSRIEEQGIFPPGVLNLVNGRKGTVDALIDAKEVCGISFVGSTTVARYIYDRCNAARKRVQAQASAKNYIVVMPDARLSAALPNMINSFFGNAGERCLAGANLVLFERNHDEVLKKFTDRASELRVGYGLDESTEMGPLITREHRSRVISYIEKGISEGAELELDGRELNVPEYPKGNFLGPSVFDDVSADMTIAKEEIFGPVASVISAADLDEAISMVNSSTYGNMASIYTTDAAAARKFKLEAKAGNLGINIGVAAPAATYPFCGYRDSFFGTLHGQGGEDYLSFYTERKVAIERWF
jgi:malonate-semialdehyde dehydrogenase (acetylating)/methylmalonate-semialdehyde dehydrogenase